MIYSTIFPSKVQNLTVFSIIYMIRIRFFGPGELNQNGFSGTRFADLLTGLRNDDIQEFDSKWDGIVSMTQIPSDDILEGLYKLRIRESEKLKTVLELHDLEFRQKIRT